MIDFAVFAGIYLTGVAAAFFLVAWTVRNDKRPDDDLGCMLILCFLLSWGAFALLATMNFLFWIGEANPISNLANYLAHRLVGPSKED